MKGRELIEKLKTMPEESEVMVSAAGAAFVVVSAVVILGLVSVALGQPDTGVARMLSWGLRMLGIIGG